MKNLVIVFFIIIFDANAQNTTTKESVVLVDEILKENYQEYIGKKVEDFLKIKYVKEYKEYLFFDNRPGVLSGVLLIISDNFHIKINVDNYNYLKQFDIDRNWDFCLFKKEEISRIKFVIDNKTLLDVR